MAQPVNDRLLGILQHAAFLVRDCKICKCRLWFIKDVAGHTVCFDAGGTDHRLNCPGPKKPEQSAMFDKTREAFD